MKINIFYLFIKFFIYFKFFSLNERTNFPLFLNYSITFFISTSNFNLIPILSKIFSTKILAIYFITDVYSYWHILSNSNSAIDVNSHFWFIKEIKKLLTFIKIIYFYWKPTEIYHYLYFMWKMNNSLVIRKKAN